MVASIAVAPESARASFFPGSRACQSNCIRMASSLGDNIVDHAVCLKAEYLWHTVLSNENGEFYTYDIYSYLKRSVCFFNGIAYLMKVNVFVQVGVPSCSDDLTHRSSANFKCEVADVNNGIPIDFRAIDAFRWNLVNHVVLNFSWYIQFNWFVQQIFQ